MGSSPGIEADRTRDARLATIRVEHLRKVYRLGDQALTALDDVSLTVRDGEFISLVGPSGCGKTTLLNIVAGLDAKSGGRVEIHGEEIVGPSRNVGMMFQSPVLLPWRSNLDNVLLPIEVFGLPRAQYVDAALGLLKLVGLSDFAGRYPFELSGGMQQRVAICRMLLYDPVVLVMDEPFAALDEMSREFMDVELMRIWEEHRKTVLFVTHNIAESVFLSDRVIVMSARPGRITASIDVDLPRPRTRTMLSRDDFFHHVTEVRKALE